MQEFPFTSDEWTTVRMAVVAILNATAGEDDVLCASCFVELQEVLAELRNRHGEHPVLLETEADLTDDNDEQIALYRQAIELAERHHLSTLSIRISLARVFIEEDQKPLALLELRACESELIDADGYDRKEWSQLKEESEL